MANSKMTDALQEARQADKALSDLEHMIEQLKREYEIFFAGGAKRPPIDLRNNTEKSVRKFASVQTLNNAQRFRYNSLASRFNVYAELWNKQMRLKEEGKLPQAQTTQAVEPKRRPEPGPPVAEGKLKELFKSYVATKPATGGAGAVLNYDNFVRALSKQKEQILKEHQCKDVEFYLAEEDGRMKLKARMIK